MFKKSIHSNRPGTATAIRPHYETILKKNSI